MKSSTMKAAAIALPLAFSAGNANSSVLELALLIDGSGSISSSDFSLQIDAYQATFDDDFYTNIIAPSAFDSIFVGAWQFATSVEFIGEQSIASDADAESFRRCTGTNYLIYNTLFSDHGAIF